MPTTIEAPRIDVTRNERGEVLLSVELPKTSGLGATGDAGVVLLLWRDGADWRGAVRDAADPSMAVVTLPVLPIQGAAWIASVSPCAAPTDIDDPRREGGRYVLVVEVVGDGPKAGYWARIQPLVRKGG